MHQIPSIRYQVSDIKYQISSFRYYVSDIKYQISDIAYQISNIWQYLTISQPMCWIYQYVAILKLFHYAPFFLTWASPRGAFAPENKIWSLSLQVSHYSWNLKVYAKTVGGRQFLILSQMLIRSPWDDLLLKLKQYLIPPENI